MATRKAIENLLKNVNITIDIEKILYILNDKDVKEKLVKTPKVDESLLENAQYIDYKKLLLVVIDDLQDLAKRYIGISKKLEEENKKQMEKAITLAKRHIKPEETIKVYIAGENRLVNSKEIIYGQKIENKNEKYDKIKKVLPVIEPKRQLEALSYALEDEYSAGWLYEELINFTLNKQGYSFKEIQNLYKNRTDNVLFHVPNKTLSLIDNAKFKTELETFLEDYKSYINADKYLLYHAHRLNQKLEGKEILAEDEKEFLNALEELSKNIEPKERIKLGDKYFYGKKDVEKFLSKYNREKQEYYTEEQLKSGEILLAQTNGHENYCSKEELRELAKIEGNLLYLAEIKCLSNSNIYSIALNNPVSMDSLISLYSLGVIDLKQLENCADKKEMNFEEIKEKVKRQKIGEGKNININDEETWSLFNQEEKLQLIVDYIDKGKGNLIKERIEELYDEKEIANLYKELYTPEKQEDGENLEIQDKRKKYENFIKLHNALGKQNSDDIINLLEEELSNEMLTNLYSDHVINMDVLESYGEKELVMGVFEQGRLHEEDVKEAIKRYPIPLQEQKICELIESGTLSARDVMDLYLNNRINLEMIKKVNEDLEEDKIEAKLDEEELVTLYQNAKKERQNENADAIMKYRRYRLLYQTLKREKLENDEKIELDKKILENLPNVTQEDLIELYKDNLLTMQTILEHGQEDAIKKLITQGDLKPSDAKAYFQSETGNIDIEQILQDPTMDDTEKMILIYSTYDDDKAKRDYLVNYLQAHTTDVKGENTAQNRNEEENREENEEKRKTVTDPYERWRLFTLLDPNYTKKYVDGYLVVNLNNTQKTIVEKMYQKRGGKVEPAYGTATFVLNTEEYENAEDELIENKRFNIATLRKKAKENPTEISKVTHHPPVVDKDGMEITSWGKRLLEKVCEEDVEETYSEVDIIEIRECLRDIERSRQEFER